jgi:putative acetyltransferase
MSCIAMSPTPIVIRPERPDHPQVRHLLQQLDAYLATLYAPEENFILDEQALLDPEISFLVAEQDDCVVGCGAVRRMPGEQETDRRPYGEIKRMMVTPALRGQRIGVRLLSSLESLLRDEGVGRALLETGGLQAEAVRLYERCGYRRRPAFGGYPDNGLSLFFEKALFA